MKLPTVAKFCVVDVFLFLRGSAYRSGQILNKLALINKGYLRRVLSHGKGHGTDVLFEFVWLVGITLCEEISLSLRFSIYLNLGKSPEKAAKSASSQYYSKGKRCDISKTPGLLFRWTNWNWFLKEEELVLWEKKMVFGLKKTAPEQPHTSMSKEYMQCLTRKFKCPFWCPCLKKIALLLSAQPSESALINCEGSL